MNKIIKVVLAIIGACSVVMDILTPLAIALLWNLLFNLSDISSTIIVIVGGLAAIFRAIKVGWLNE